jgi:site-specific DNA-methyltransferase (adenine-specific)
MKCHENVLIFYKKLPTYNPQKTTGHTPVHAFTKHSTDGTNYGKTHSVSGGGSTERYPRDVIQFKWDTQKSAVHPTQKPISAAEYFIKTYTNEGDTVLDSCMGSGSAGVACARLNRNFIGIEKDEKYFNTCIERFKAEGFSNKLPLVKVDNFVDTIVLEADLRKQNDLQ